jgi:uncharacterized membrane protein
MSPEEMLAFLDQYDLRYVFYGPSEKAMAQGRLPLEEMPFLVRTYSREGTQLYRVRGGGG